MARRTDVRFSCTPRVSLIVWFQFAGLGRHIRARILPQKTKICCSTAEPLLERVYYESAVWFYISRPDEKIPRVLLVGSSGSFRFCAAGERASASVAGDALIADL